MTEYQRTYTVRITLVAENPAYLPDIIGGEELIFDQMSGELNDDGLFCGVVEAVSIKDDPRRVYNVNSRGVVELANDDPAATVCDYCHRGWDDTVATALTPTPAGRCPFEYEHTDAEDDEMEKGQ